MQLKPEDAKRAEELDAASARDRWTWVSLARSMAASSLERSRARARPEFYLTLPQQEEGPGA